MFILGISLTPQVLMIGFVAIFVIPFMWNVIKLFSGRS
jgi:hypothetical protein